MYIIVVGAGKVGWNLARELLEKEHEVTRDREQPPPLPDRRAGARAQRLLRRRLRALGAGAGRDPARRHGDRGHRRRRGQHADLPGGARRSTWSSQIIARVNNPRNRQHFDLLGIKPSVSATDLILRLLEHEVPEYGLVHLLDLQEEQLEIIEMLLGKDSRRHRPPGRRPADAGGQPADLGPARRQGLRARPPTPCSRPATRCSPCSTPGNEDELKELFGPDGERRRQRASGRPRGRLPADRRRHGLRPLRGGAAQARRRGLDPAGRPRAGAALRTAAALEGVPARRGRARGRLRQPAVLVRGERGRAADRRRT